MNRVSTFSPVLFSNLNNSFCPLTRCLFINHSDPLPRTLPFLIRKNKRLLISPSSTSTISKYKIHQVQFPVYFSTSSSASSPNTEENKNSSSSLSSTSFSQPKELSLTLPEKFVNSCPKSWQPFLRLSRVDRPIGTWLLFWPATWGLCLGSEGLPSPVIFSLFAAGAFIMRGAGCTINDLWDKNIDGLVKRTSFRPLPSGQVTSKPAIGWVAGQLSLALGILFSLQSLPCIPLALGSLGLVVIYPLAKRVTNWPQAVLGLTFNTGILFGYTATGQFTNATLFPWFEPTCLSFYFGAVFWTLIYDSIYAHQDRLEDSLLGLGSTARRFGDSTKIWLSAFSLGMLSCLTAGGILASLSWPYYTGLTCTACHLLWQIKTLDINKPKNCGERFLLNRHIGWMILLGMLASYYYFPTKVKKDDKNNIINNDNESSSLSSGQSIKIESISEIKL